MENFEKIDVRNQITHNSYFYDNRIQYFKGQNYLALKTECVKNKRLFVDSQFPPSNSSLYYSKPIPNNIKWLRPHQIVKSGQTPEFVVNKVEAHDLDQGYLGNCWFIAGCAAITFMPELFSKVVPTTQTFSGDDYCGIFHFRFWIYGFWHDVVVDDFLPVWDHNNQLAFCSNKEEPNEFWAALLEKAYAKVCGNYENLEGGFTSDALIDLTGGIQETFPLDSVRSDKDRETLWKIISKSSERKSMAAAYIEPNPSIFEERLPNGLIKGHAYTISQKTVVKVRGGEVRLLRLRNPWGRIEWKGAWSDSSPEWNQISADMKQSLEFKIDNEGEFWMSFEDFCRSFNSIQFCHMTPDAFSDEILKPAEANSRIGWKMVAYHGEWSLSDRSAGGSGNYGDSRFWSNPQFLIHLVDVDTDDSEEMATVIVALMQKYTREKRSQRNGDMAEEFIQFRIFKVINESDGQKSTVSGEKLTESQLERVGNSGDYINKREVTSRFKFHPGYYVIIPSTFDAGVEGQFMLRVFTEKLIESRNSVILNRDESSFSRPTVKINSSNNQDGLRHWVSSVGHRAVDKVDRAREAVRSHMPESKSQFAGNIFSKLVDENAERSASNFKKEVVAIKKSLKLEHTCSLM